MWRPSTYT
nr:unnamed protein product [Callosobruchus analis]CAI5855470.1 unnamed protein product [Callosobruchus analis]CAI5867267.1 unnamed protein product [Callosobruchus analis]